MYDFTIKTLKLGFWILLPFLLISNSNSLSMDSTIIEGSYELELSGFADGKLEGTVQFEEDRLNNNLEGVSGSSLRLIFTSADPKEEHSFEFLITEPQEENGITNGTYSVTRNINGFINGFEGLFGFADITTLGEQPFFTHEGKITIIDSTEKGKLGQIHLSLKDVEGRTIGLEGTFMALGSLDVR